MFGVAIAGEEPRRLILLAEQIENHVQAAKVCGIIYHTPTPPRFSLRSRVASGLSFLGNLFSSVLLGAVHGRLPHASQINVSSRDILAHKCQQAGWDLHLTENIESDETKNFIRKGRTDLLVLMKLTCMPSRPENSVSGGVIAGQIHSLDKQEMEAFRDDKGDVPLGVTRVQVTQSASHGERQLATFDLHPGPLDTRVSVELKSNLILRDLLVQSIAALAQQPDEAPRQVQAWARSMIPSYLWPDGMSQCKSSLDQAPPLRVRARWKLFIYSLLLLSPSVILRNWQYRRRKQYPLLFLTSHLISDRHHRMALPTQAFLSIVRYLKKRYRIVSFSEACQLLKAGTISEPTVVLTFDDGYEDNFVNLRAVCEELDVPVVLFVSTDAVSRHQEFWHDFGRGLAGFRALTWNQIRYWSTEGVEFHSHSCSHYDCGSLDEDWLKKELTESKRVLEEQLGKRVTAFAFPFGKPKNMSAPAMEIAARIYDYFLSSFGGENMPNASVGQKHLLRKHLQGNAWESELEIQGVFVIARSLKQLLGVRSTVGGYRSRTVKGCGV
jgi:peptidoglycan/xylan/chitin deacetylase (PgdA/CDA1 family)